MKIKTLETYAILAAMALLAGAVTPRAHAVSLVQRTDGVVTETGGWPSNQSACGGCLAGTWLLFWNTQDVSLSGTGYISQNCETEYWGGTCCAGRVGPITDPTIVHTGGGSIIHVASCYYPMNHLTATQPAGCTTQTWMGNCAYGFDTMSPGDPQIWQYEMYYQSSGTTTFTNNQGWAEFNLGYSATTWAAVFEAVNCDSLPNPTTTGISYDPDNSTQPVETGTYKIVSRLDGLVIDRVNSGTAPGTRLEEWAYWGGPMQKWNLRSIGTTGNYASPGGQTTGGSWYFINNYADGLSMDVVGDNGANGTQIDVWTPIDANSGQMYQLVPTSGGYYNIVPLLDFTTVPLPANQGSCIDIPDSNTTPGTILDLWTRNGGNNQQWAFQAP